MRQMRSGDQMKVNDLVSNLWALCCPYRLRPRVAIIGKSKTGKTNYQNYIDSSGRGSRKSNETPAWLLSEASRILSLEERIRPTKRPTTQVPSTWSSDSNRHPSPPYMPNIKQLEITSSPTANTNPVLSGVSTFQHRQRRPCPSRH
jgi:hypothetical protein